MRVVLDARIHGAGHAADCEVSSCRAVQAAALISNPGIGSKSLPNTDVYYLRTRSGARVFFRNNEQGFEIVGKANKGNESSVIGRLTELYKR